MERGVDRQPCSQPAAKKRRRKRENENSKEAGSRKVGDNERDAQCISPP